MEENTNPTPSQNRIVSVDALRGFAVLAILLLHALEHFIYNVYPDSASPLMMSLDKSTKEAIFFLLAGKSYAMFALLFGFTFAIQYRNREKKGEDFCGRFAWRLLLLAGFATFNSIFFPGGDVLMLFAIMGLILLPVRKLSQKNLLIIAGGFLLQPLELFYILRLFLDTGGSAPVFLNESHYPAVEAAVKSGQFLPMLLTNISAGQAASLLWAADAGRLLQAPGLFILGLYLARSDRFQETKNNFGFWAKVLVFSVIGSLILYIAKGGFSAPNPIEKVLVMWYNIAFAGILVSSFLLAYRSDWFKSFCHGLSVYGKMSLTNYVGQSLIGSLIFFPYALNLAPVLGIFSSLIVGILIAWMQITFCKWWLARHKLGPLEGIWHKLTWFGSKPSQKN